MQVDQKHDIGVLGIAHRAVASAALSGENVLLAAATLYQLRIDFVDSDAEQSTGFVSVLDVERIAAAVRGER